MSQKILSIKNLIVLIIFCISFPFILLIFKPDLLVYLKIHLAISIILLFLGTFAILKQRTKQSPLYWILLYFLIFYPCFLIATFPFSLSSFLVSISIIMFGLVIPHISLKTTWWLYTIGGRCPLPERHKWLINNNGDDKKKEKYSKFVARVGNLIILPAVVIGVLLSMSQNDSYVIVILKSLSLLVMFGLGLTAGTKIKKDFFLNTI